MIDPKRHLTIKVDSMSFAISVTWLVDGRIQGERYEIPKRETYDAGDSVRRALAGLESVASLVDDAGPHIRDALQSVAAAGQNLYRALFTGRDEANDTAAQAIRTWFEQTVLADPEPWHIQFVQMEGAVMPWGLTFTERPGRDLSRLGVGIGDYDDFWCLKFACAIRSISEPHKPVTLNHNVKFGVLIETEDEAFDQYYKSRLDDMLEEERENLKSMFLKTFDQAVKARKQVREQNCYYYVFLKAEPDSGTFRHGDEALRPDKILPDGEEIRLVLFDGDAVIRSDRGDAWIDFCLRKPLSGCIAVEADILSPRNRLFGWAIFEHVIRSGAPLIEAMAQARKAYWPMSLLYGVYCNPLNVRLEGAFKDLDAVSRYIDFQKAQGGPA